MSPETNTKRLNGLAKARDAMRHVRHERAERNGGMVEVCFKLPRNEYAAIQSAAEREHRSASNYFWHHAVLAARATP